MPDMYDMYDKHWKYYVIKKRLGYKLVINEKALVQILKRKQHWQRWKQAALKDIH